MALARLLEFISGSKLTPHLALILLQFIGSISLISTQAILDAGVDSLVLGFYCFGIAGVVFSIASLFERGTRADLNLLFIPLIIVVGFLVLLLQVLTFIGISKTSATFKAALDPTLTVFTAVFAVLARVEILKPCRYDGQVKLIGILICMAGAGVMSLYRGPCVVDGGSCSEAEVPPKILLRAAENPLDFQLGALCILLSSALTAALTVTGAFFATRYYTALTSILSRVFMVGAVISGIGAYFTVDGPGWIVPTSLTPLLLFIALCSLTLIPVLIMWSIRKLGPTIVSCYQPGSTIITAVVSVAYLGTSIYLGSVLGAVLIAIGLILVTWSQEETKRLMNEESLLTDACSSGEQVSLLNVPPEDQDGKDEENVEI